MASSKSGSKKQSSSQEECGGSRSTTDHEEIRAWVEERGGRPACVKGTDSGDTCLLRIDYPGFAGEDRLEPIEWEEFFEIFDEQELVFLFQEQTKDCQPSRFSKFVSRENAPGEEDSGGGSGRGSKNGGGSKSRQSSSKKSSGGRSSSGRSGNSGSKSSR
jgi:hypothetical protein